MQLPKRTPKIGRTSLMSWQWLDLPRNGTCSSSRVCHVFPIVIWKIGVFLWFSSGYHEDDQNESFSGWLQWSGSGGGFCRRQNRLKTWLWAFGTSSIIFFLFSPLNLGFRDPQFDFSSYFSLYGLVASTTWLFFWRRKNLELCENPIKSKKNDLPHPGWNVQWANFADS